MSIKVGPFIPVKDLVDKRYYEGWIQDRMVISQWNNEQGLFVNKLYTWEDEYEVLYEHPEVPKEESFEAFYPVLKV